MLENTHARTLLTVVEDYLVQEFRLMQNLIEITKQERTFFPTGKADELMSVVENKESILDQLTLLEEKRRTVVQELGRGDACSIEDILFKRNSSMD